MTQCRRALSLYKNKSDEEIWIHLWLARVHAVQTALRTGAAVRGSQASIGKWMDAPLQQVPSAASVKQGFISADSKQNSKNEKNTPYYIWNY